MSGIVRDTNPASFAGETDTPIDLVWDMETNDPDDFLTLIFLLGHPRVRLKAVTIMPGSPWQVGLVRWALSQFGASIPVGAFNIHHEKRCVSPWHYRAYGDIPPSNDALPGPEVLRATCDERTTLLCGAPLKNLGALLAQDGDSRLARLVVQGGFAGEGVVPPALQLPKFRGLSTCASHNPNGDPSAVMAALEAPGIGVRYFVSKNVCHGIVWDAAMHAQVASLSEFSLAARLMRQGMEVYLSAHPEGKKIHDLVAACCAIDPRIGRWAEVEIYRKRGEWGARTTPGTSTWITTDCHFSGLLDILTQVSLSRPSPPSAH